MLDLLRGTGTSSPPMRLIGRRLYLRPATMDDFPAWAKLRESSREFLTPWEPSWPRDALSREFFHRRLRRHAEEWRRDETFSFLFFRRVSDELVGGVTLSNVRRGVAQMGTLGYWVGAPFAGDGFMTEAVGIICQFAFDHLGLHRVEAACLPANTASRRVLEKNGFLEEGLARGYLKINGYWQDHVQFGLVEHEWRNRYVQMESQSGTATSPE